MEVTILLFSPLRIVFFQHLWPYEFFITTILQIKNRESCCYSTFDSFWMVVGWHGSLCSHLDTFFFCFRKPPSWRTTHGRSITETAIWLRIVARHPLLISMSKTCMAMFIGTFPKISRHIKAINESLCTSEGAHRIICKMSSWAKHFHLIIIFSSVCTSFICTACNVANSSAHQ